VLTSEQLPEDAPDEGFSARVLLLVYATGLVTTPLVYWLGLWVYRMI
jgi:hypothetical protein